MPKFDGELPATDPIEHIEESRIWARSGLGLDKKASPSTGWAGGPLKLLLEQVGYVVLDCSSSAQSRQQPRWRKPIILLHSSKTRLNDPSCVQTDESDPAQQQSSKQQSDQKAESRGPMQIGNEFA
uniref:Uncharacterized protein n=1 Tax=Macrostomum lignano TaxID=282301 RepID=A0A1I8FIX3_9PLAT